MSADEEIAELLAAAVRIVDALATSQVGDVNAMADQETVDQMEILDDEDLLFFVLRVFSGLTAILAGRIAADAHGEVETQHVDEAAIRIIRAALENLGVNIHKRESASSWPLVSVGAT